MFNLQKKIYIVLQIKPEQRIIGCFENDTILDSLKKEGHEYKSVRIPYYQNKEKYNYKNIFEELWY
jgi:hypothetical protein